jgi:acyl carrier protein
MTDQAQVGDIVATAIREFNELVPADQRMGSSPETALFGEGGKLDSLGLVSVLVAVEQGVADVLGKQVSVANEDAMSRRNSPFRTVETLTDYVCELIREC